MKIGLIGLGKMGNSIAYRLINKNHEVIGYDSDKKAQENAQIIGIKIVENLSEIPKLVDIIWLMVPAGEIIDNILKGLLPDLKPETIIIDGGNSHFLDSIERSKRLEKYGIHFIDCGVSGGLQGRELGFCLMIGGEKKAYDKLKEIFEAISAPNGYKYVGQTGAGHYVKMIHNGIEYALLESYSEGLNLLKNGKYKNLNLKEITDLWQHGSIIRSWILHLTYEIFEKGQEFNNISGYIAGGQTGKWVVEEAKLHKIPVPLIEKSIEIREISHEKENNYANKIVALLRNKFGGHEIKKIN